MASREAAILSQIEGLMEEFVASPAGDTPIGDAVQKSLEESIRPGLEELRNGDEGMTGQPEVRPEPEEKPQYRDFDSARHAAKRDIESKKAEPQPEEDEDQEETKEKKFGSRR